MDVVIFARIGVINLPEQELKRREQQIQIYICISENTSCNTMSGFLRNIVFELPISHRNGMSFKTVLCIKVHVEEPETSLIVRG